MSVGFDISTIKRQVEESGPLVRVLIAEHQGSTPRMAGTSMLVTANSEIGTIGGGALEFAAVEAARKLLGQKSTRNLVNFPLGPSLGQCCGGAVKLLFENVNAESLADLEKLEGFYIRPVTSGENQTEPPLKVKKTVLEMQSGVRKSEIRLLDSWLIEPLHSGHTPLWIYGAGHVGRAIVATMHGLPYAITWIDTAHDRFPEPMPEGVDMLVAKSPADAVKHAPNDAKHLVLTYSHGFDLEICQKVLSRSFGSLGLIGSDTKRTRFMKRLAAAGISDVTLQRLDCPIGDRTLGKEPMAIAIGVANELLKNRGFENRRLEVSA